jgi:hypothetical protein
VALVVQTLVCYPYERSCSVCPSERLPCQTLGRSLAHYSLSRTPACTPESLVGFARFGGCTALCNESATAMHIDGILVRTVGIGTQRSQLLSEAATLVDNEGQSESEAEVAATPLKGPLAEAVATPFKGRWPTFRVELAYIDDRKIAVPHAATRYPSDHFAVVAETNLGSSGIASLRGMRAGV